MKKTAVIFPGIGYTIDKPLLYYSRKAALEHGYDVISVEYSGVDKDCLRHKEKMTDAFNKAFMQVEEQLKETDPASGGDIIFISKSIGTVIAAVYAEKYDIKARQLFFTPLEQTFLKAEEGNGLVYFGDNDPWIETDTIRRLCEEYKMPYRIFAGANHSLETGRVHEDVDNIQFIMHEAEDYIAGIDKVYCAQYNTTKDDN